MDDEQGKRPWPPWGGLMALAIVLTPIAPLGLLTRLLFNDTVLGIVIGFLAGIAAVVLWVRRYEGSWEWCGD